MSWHISSVWLKTFGRWEYGQLVWCEAWLRSSPPHCITLNSCPYSVQTGLINQGLWSLLQWASSNTVEPLTVSHIQHWSTRILDSFQPTRLPSKQFVVLCSKLCLQQQTVLQCVLKSVDMSMKSPNLIKRSNIWKFLGSVPASIHDSWFSPLANSLVCPRVG